VTLGRLLLAWVPVAALFVVTPPIGYAWDAVVGKGEIGWRLAEAAVVTLLASLWFDSLGASGWWLVFFLVGLLVAFPRRLVMFQHMEPQRRRHLLAHAGLDIARYVAAGGLLAWRLS